MYQIILSGETSWCNGYRHRHACVSELRTFTSVIYRRWNGGPTCFYFPPGMSVRISLMDIKWSSTSFARECSRIVFAVFTITG